MNHNVLKNASKVPVKEKEKGMPEKNEKSVSDVGYQKNRYASKEYYN